MASITSTSQRGTWISHPHHNFIELSSTTTVVMKAHESLDARVAGARVVGNGFDGPRVASCVERSTRPAAPRANAQVRAAQWPTSGALPVRSTGPAHRFPCFFFL